MGVQIIHGSLCPGFVLGRCDNTHFLRSMKLCSHIEVTAASEAPLHDCSQEKAQDFIGEAGR